jgi:hypothetical protein
LGASNYVGNAGYLGVDPLDTNAARVAFSNQFKGPYYVNSKTRMTEIADGTSNTIGFGETLGGSANPRNFRMSWMGAGSMVSAYGLQNTGDWYLFSSKHNGIVQFGYCDGSVHGIRTGITGSRLALNPSYSAWISACGMADGQVVDFNQLGQ